MVNLLNIEMNELKIIDKIELDECPICYEGDIINRVCLSCGHECCFDCFKTWFFYVLKKERTELECFMCRKNINHICLSKENKFILNCILEEFKNMNKDEYIFDGINYGERRVKAIRFIIPLLFCYFIYYIYYDNK